MKEQFSINIDTAYTRSINIQRDVDSSAVVSSYIVTSRALLTLRKFVDTMGEKHIPRSWALIGPYGSGKSSFAVYLNHLLGDPNDHNSKMAYKLCSEVDGHLHAAITEETANSKGYFSILLTGTPEPLRYSFLRSLKQSVECYCKTLRGRKPALLSKVTKAFESEEVSLQDIVEFVKEFSSLIGRNGGRGILIIIDELGKFLEYEARHYDVNDIYLLQALAETAVKGRNANIYLFTLMHQGFEQYGRSLGEELRNEWAKVQGRFETIPFLESTEQTLKILSRAIRKKISPKAEGKLHVTCDRLAQELSVSHALPNTLQESVASELFYNCYPLHPITALLLPILCQKMAQNERTLFSYLGSQESFGLSDRIKGLKGIDDWVMPWTIFDYFIENQTSVLFDPITSRRWAEVLTALDRLEDCSDDQEQLLKTIGLFNIIGGQGGLKASESLLRQCFTPEKFSTNISILQRQAVIQFRKFSQEYRVWEGSDFDLEAAIKDEIEHVGNFDLPDLLNSKNPLQPLVGRKHTISTGSLRYFSPVFADRSSYKKLKKDAYNQRIIFYLASSDDDFEQACRDLPIYFSEIDFVAICPNGTALRNACTEVFALRRIQETRAELQTDPVAQREFKERILSAFKIEEQLLSKLVDRPAGLKWFREKCELEILDRKQLQSSLSKALDLIYFKSPKIFNELINRAKPSAQAAAARNKLVSALVHNVEKSDLGIEKFPAEKGLYRALLHATKLHQELENGNWGLVPPQKDDKYNFFHVWLEIEKFLETTSEKPRSFAELNEILQVRPYGVKAGVIPILYLTAFLCYQDKLAIYEDDIYTPYISDQHIERFMRRPDYFKIQYVKIEGVRATLFQEYTNVLYNASNTGKDYSLLSVAKPLAQFVANLEDFTKQTYRITKNAQRVRKAFELAKSPIDLLFVRLPKACGFNEVDQSNRVRGEADSFASVLVDVIRELRDSYKKMRKDLVTVVCNALLPGFDKTVDLKTLREKARKRYSGLIEHTTDIKDLRPFIEHVIDEEGEDELWFNRLLLFLGGRAPDKWTDAHRDLSVKRIEDFSRRLIDLKTLQDHYNDNHEQLNGSYEVVWLRSMKHGKKDQRKFIHIDKDTKLQIKEPKKEILSLIDKLDNEDLKLALVAGLVENYLGKTKNN